MNDVMTKNNVEPLPCPFCGGEPNLDFYHEAGRWDVYQVVCKTCVISIEGPHGFEGNKAQIEAISAWNTRASPDFARDRARAQAEIMFTSNEALRAKLMICDGIISQLQQTIAIKDAVVTDGLVERVAKAMSDECQIRRFPDEPHRRGKWPLIRELKYEWMERAADAIAAMPTGIAAITYQQGYDHGADKFRAALEAERRIAAVKDAEITAQHVGVLNSVSIAMNKLQDTSQAFITAHAEHIASTRDREIAILIDDMNSMLATQVGVVPSIATAAQILSDRIRKLPIHSTYPSELDESIVIRHDMEEMLAEWAALIHPHILEKRK